MRTGVDDCLGYAWATALNAIYAKDRFGAVTNVVFGENNGAGARGGSFHSLMVIPYYWVMEKRLQAVFQYQYAGASEAEGMPTNSRYVRSQHSPGVNVNGGHGDELHTLYAGLNYHICGDNAKIMTGIEYSSLDTPDGDVSALTYLSHSARIFETPITGAPFDMAYRRPPNAIVTNLSYFAFCIHLTQTR